MVSARGNDDQVEGMAYAELFQGSVLPRLDILLHCLQVHRKLDDSRVMREDLCIDRFKKNAIMIFSGAAIPPSVPGKNVTWKYLLFDPC